MMHLENLCFSFEGRQIANLLSLFDKIENFRANKAGHDELPNVVQKRGGGSRRRNRHARHTRDRFRSQHCYDRMPPERAFAQPIGAQLNAHHGLGVGSDS